MYAVIRSGSKQYRVQKGDVIRVELLPQEAGQVEFHEVLFLAKEGQQPQIGAPTVQNSKVVGELLGMVQGKKIQSIKYKRRKNAYCKFGHRQKYSQVKIVDIVG